MNWFVDDSVKKERISICNSCDKLNKIRQCKVCKCFVDFKATLKSEKCPDKPSKWKSIS